VQAAVLIGEYRSAAQVHGHGLPVPQGGGGGDGEEGEFTYGYGRMTVWYDASHPPNLGSCSSVGLVCLAVYCPPLPYPPPPPPRQVLESSPAGSVSAVNKTPLGHFFYDRLDLIRLQENKCHHRFNLDLDWMNPYVTLNSGLVRL
jgi:hypothetical protein